MKLYSNEAEQAVLGGILIDKDAYAIASDLIASGDFYRDSHADIWRAMAQLAENNKAIDVVTVGERMEAVGTLDEAGGLAYLFSLARDTPSSSNVRAYSGIIRDRSVRRQTIQAAKRAESFAQELSTAEEALDMAQAGFSGIEAGKASEGAVAIQELLPAWIDDLQERFEGRKSSRGLSTGITRLDSRISGLCPGRLYVIGGRPAMGKSVLAGQMAVHAAAHGPVLYWTGEMPKEEVTTRCIASAGEVQLDVLEDTSLIDDGHWARITRAVTTLNESSLHVDETPGISVWELRKRARKVKGISLVVCDYLQLMHGDGDNRSQQMGSISRGLKDLSKELHIPVVMVSSLSRTVESRADKRPILGDLRESGEIDHDVDVCIMVYRAEAYDENSTDKGFAELLVRKNRGGRIGAVPAIFRGEVCRFENCLDDPPSWSHKAEKRGRF